MNPTCRRWPYRSAAALDIQLRLKVRSVGAESGLPLLLLRLLLLLLWLLLLRVEQARQIGMRLRIARLRLEVRPFRVLVIVMMTAIILLTLRRLCCIILLLVKRAKLIGRTLNAIVLLLLPLLNS